MVVTVVVQEKRGASWRLFYGRVLEVGDERFTVAWRDAGALRAPSATWPLAQLRYMRVAGRGDWLHWFQNEETTYWGRVVRRVARRDRQSVSLQVDWGDMEAEWGAAEANRLVTKFEFSGRGRRLAWDKYAVVEADEVDCAAEGGGVRPDWRAVLTAHNRGVGLRASPLMPVPRVGMLRALAGLRPGAPPVARRSRRRRPRRMLVLLRARLRSVLEGALAIEPAAGPVQTASWLRGDRIGWSTADSLLVSSRGYVELNFKRVLAGINAVAAVVDTRRAVGLGVREWKEFVGSWVAPQLNARADWLRALIAEGHLQGVELATLTSVAGSRVHMAMQLKLDGRSTVERAAADADPDMTEAAADVEAVAPYIPNFPPSDAALRYFQSTADLDALVAQMADALHDFLFDGTDLAPLASELPVADLDQLWIKGGKALAVESRIDLLAVTADGRLVLCDYSEYAAFYTRLFYSHAFCLCRTECRFGDTTMALLGEADTVRQLATYAWLLYTNYGLVVDELWQVTVTRELDCTRWSAPFALALPYVEVWARGCAERVVVDRLFAAQHNNVPFATTRAARLLAELRGEEAGEAPAIADVVAQASEPPARSVHPNVGTTTFYDGVGLRHAGKGVYEYAEDAAIGAAWSAAEPAAGPAAGPAAEPAAEPAAGPAAEPARLSFHAQVQKAGEELASRWPHDGQRLASALGLPYRAAPRDKAVLALVMRALNRHINALVREKLDFASRERFWDFVGDSQRSSWPVWDDSTLFRETRALLNVAFGQVMSRMQ